jgi:hypothetical protein
VTETTADKTVREALAEILGYELGLDGIDLADDNFVLGEWTDEFNLACLASGLEDTFLFELTKDEEAVLAEKSLTVGRLLTLIENKLGGRW